MIKPEVHNFIENENGYAELLTQYEDDMTRAQTLAADSETAAGAVYLLPNEGWARRIVGVMGNDLAKQYPDRAHALLVAMGLLGLGFVGRGAASSTPH